MHVAVKSSTSCLANCLPVNFSLLNQPARTHPPRQVWPVIRGSEGAQGPHVRGSGGRDRHSRHPQTPSPICTADNCFPGTWAPFLLLE